MTETENQPDTDDEVSSNQDIEISNANDPLVNLLPSARVQLLAALVRAHGEKLNPTELCERAEVDRATWYRQRDELVDTYGVIEEAGHAGNSPLYRMNMDHPIVKRLDEIRILAAAERDG
jgi:antitoxin (DNA-binding transcriptional repressor) of toxin-antitoxin stability system